MGQPVFFVEKNLKNRGEKVTIAIKQGKCVTGEEGLE